MFDPRLIRSLVAFCVVTAPLAAPTSALTPKTPPPCSADGACKPNLPQWGYTQQKWRRWPGSEDRDKKPGEAEGAVQLPGTSPPRKQDEDKTAPPKVEGIEPQPREFEEDTEGTDDGFAPRRPGEDAFPPRAPERQPGGQLAPPDNRLPVPRNGERGVELPFGDQPQLNQPGLRQPGLGQPPVGQPPFNQPPVRPQDPTFDDPTLPPAGGSNPDDQLFPSFRSPSINEDAPPALPLLNGPMVERPRVSTGVVSQAPITIPQPTADSTTAAVPSPSRAPQVSPTGPVGGASVAGSRATAPKVDRSIKAASHQQDAPPSLPSVLLQ